MTYRIEANKMPLILEWIKCNVVKQCTSVIVWHYDDGMDLIKTVKMRLILETRMICRRYLWYLRMFWLSKWNFWFLHLPHPLPIFHFESHVKNKWKCTCTVRDVSKAQSWRAVLRLDIACQSPSSPCSMGKSAIMAHRKCWDLAGVDWIFAG